MEWRTDFENAHRDGRKILCCWAGEEDSACLLIWKHNPRLERPPRWDDMTAAEKDWFEKRSTDYFGDPDEWDDYDLALPENYPTHWAEVSVPQ